MCGLAETKRENREKMKIALLHVSDIHIQKSSDVILSRAEKICATLNPLLPDVEAVMLIVTGDIAYGGKKAEYDLAEKFFKEILEGIEKKVRENVPVYFISVPGNHDGVFKDFPNAGVRNSVIGSVLSNSPIDEGMIRICVEPQEHYFEFEKKFDTRFLTFEDALWKQHVIQVHDKRILFSALNASWLSQVPEVPGKLVFPDKRYLEQAKVDADVKVVLMHHPLNWYAQASYHPLREMCRSRYQFVMSGHEHTANATAIHDLEHGDSVMLEAGVMAKNGTDVESHFSVVTIDLNGAHVAQKEFEWRGDSYTPKDGDAVWDSYMPLPSRKNNGFALTEEFRGQLEDIGATFSHPNKERLRLQDIYIFPDLQDIYSDADPPETFSAKILISDIKRLKKILIRGDDQYGKTALLHTLSQKYFSAGYVPVLITGADLGSGTDEQLQRRLLNAVERQYGVETKNQYLQLESERKILLLDDLDRHGISEKSIARSLNYVLRHFEYAVVAAGERFDLAEILSTETVEASRQFNHFRCLGFGYRLRSQLIRKWFSIGDETSEAIVQKKSYDAQVVIDAVIGKGLVPTTAFNIMVLLQAMEMGTGGALANAGMAKYYEYLIRKSFLKAKGKPDEFDEIDNYLGHVAYLFHSQRATSIDEGMLYDFSREYSKKYTNIDFVERMDFLVRAQTLVKAGSAYSFKYPYVKYFYAAYFLAKNVESNPNLKEVIVHACHHLYLKENGNIILFLAHHLPSQWVIEEVVSVLKQLLQKTPALNVQADTSIINAWVNKTARLIVDTSDVVKNREEEREKEDQSEQRKESEPSCEVKSLSELDYMSQMNLLFKTSEILGQILKNRYGSLDKPFKKSLMAELFKGPLRGINFFLSSVNARPEAFLEELSARFMERVPSINKEQADKIAKRMIFGSISLFGLGIMIRQSEILGSPKLKETLDELVQEQKPDQKVTYQLLSIAAQLNYPGSVPLASIESCAQALKENVFGFRLLQGMVARHLYMFALPHDQKQALGKATNISELSQRSITLQSTDSKRLPSKSGNRVPHAKSLILSMQKSFLLRNKEVLEKRLGGGDDSVEKSG